MESSSEYSNDENTTSRPASFEETYPRYEFAEMVRIGLVLAEWIAAGANWLTNRRRRQQGSSSGMASKPSADQVAWPAE
jgi:hypothetical protein